MKYIKAALMGMILLNASITAQFYIPSSVTGSGGSPMSGSSYAVNGTVGQSYTGILSGNYSLSSGFWYTTSAVLTDVQENDENIPYTFELLQNYPNPFNPSTTIKFSVAEESPVVLKVFDLLGSEIVTLVNKELKPGRYSIEFNAANLASGIYFYSITANQFRHVKKLMVLK